MTDKVMRLSVDENRLFKPAINPGKKKCDHCKQEEKLQKRRDSPAIGGLTAPSAAHNVINSFWQPLNVEITSFFETNSELISAMYKSNVFNFITIE